MKKTLSFLVILTSLFFVTASTTHAGFITINKDGSITWNVLSSEVSDGPSIPKREELAIKDVIGTSEGTIPAEVSLGKDNGKVELKVTDSSGGKKIDVTSIKGDLIEIEERPEVKTIKIGVLGEGFSIDQGGVVAQTDFPIKIDPKTAELSLETPSGIRYLAVLPREALDYILRARIITKLGEDSKVALQEENGGQLSYVIDGVRTLNVFNLFNYDVPVRAQVSAVNGEIIGIEQPSWLKVLGFIFS
jgi:hypothetical protein